MKKSTIQEAKLSSNHWKNRPPETATYNPKLTGETKEIMKRIRHLHTYKPMIPIEENIMDYHLYSFTHYFRQSGCFVPHLVKTICHN